MPHSDLYIIESPFQLVCAIEAQHSKSFKSGIKSILIVKRTNLKKNNDQIDQLLKTAKFDRTIQIPFFLGLFIGDYILACLIFSWKIRRRKLNNIFIGEIKSTIMRSFAINFDNSAVYFLDDGVSTLSIQENLLKGLKVSDLSIDGKYTKYVRNTLFKLLFVKYKSDFVPNWFTLFDLTPINTSQKIVKNNFFAIRAQIVPELEDRSSNKVYFIGSPLSEDGKYPETEELKLVKKASEYYSSQGKTVIYCVHRRESNLKLKKISDFKDISQLRFAELPIEIDFIDKSVRVNHLSTMVSTTLFTISAIMEPNNVDNLVLDERYLDHSILDNYRNLKEKISAVKNITMLDFKS